MARAVTAAGSVLSVLSKAVCWVSFARKTNCNEDLSLDYDLCFLPLPHHNGQMVLCLRLLIGYLSKFTAPVVTKCSRLQDASLALELPLLHLPPPAIVKIDHN